MTCDYHFMEIGKPIRNCYCISKTQRTICYKKINTARIQCIFKTSVFLDNVLGIVLLYSKRDCDKHGSDSSALKSPTSINLSCFEYLSSTFLIFSKRYWSDVCYVCSLMFVRKKCFECFPKRFSCFTYMQVIKAIVTVCSSHVTYAFQSEFTNYSYLNVKELLARNKAISEV